MELKLSRVGAPAESLPLFGRVGSGIRGDRVGDAADAFGHRHDRALLVDDFNAAVDDAGLPRGRAGKFIAAFPQVRHGQEALLEGAAEPVGRV